jgi:O-antigen/teichoic acid export membrane protein
MQALSPTETPPRGRLSSVIRNTLSILGSDIANRASSFALYALIGRFLGEFAFGQTQLALGFFFVGWSLAGLGIKWYITRELSKHPEQTSEYLVNASALILISAPLIFIALCVLVALSGYGAETTLAILIMGITIIPYALIMVIEGVFMGREKMQFVFYVNAPLNILNIVVSFLALSMGAGILVIMGIQVMAYLLILGIEWFLMLRYVVRPRFQVDLTVVRSLFKGTRSFSGIDATVALMTIIQPYIISRVASETEVGFYGAAGQLTSPIMLIIMSVMNSLLPALTRQVSAGYETLKVSAQRLLEVTFAITMPAVTGVILLAPQILIFLYGRDSFASAALYLRILITVLLIRAIIQVIGMLLYASSNESVNFRITVIVSLTSLVMNIIIVSQFEALGAAITSVALNLLDLCLHYFFIWKRLRIVVNPLPSIWRPALASAALSVALWQLPHEWNLLILVTAGAVIYAAAYGALLLLTIGSPAAIRAYYLRHAQPSEAEAALRSAHLIESDQGAHP